MRKRRTTAITNCIPMLSSSINTSATRTPEIALIPPLNKIGISSKNIEW